jgi:hypothetical protein
MANLNNWMSVLNDTTVINTVTMPATHDSGMSEADLTKCSKSPLVILTKTAEFLSKALNAVVSLDPKKVLANNLVTQSSNVGGQLNLGARQLDLRIGSHLTTYRAYHGCTGLAVAGLRGYGEKWADICTDIAKFMKENPDEFVVLKLDKQKHYTTKMMKMLNAALVKDYPHGPTANSVLPGGTEIDTLTIGDLRGRVLACGKKSAIRDWSKIDEKHYALTFCLWNKCKKGEYVAPECQDYPVYTLLGDANGDGTVDSSASPLDKQVTMGAIFFKKNPPQGMRGIWFNTISMIEDIKAKSDQVWNLGNLGNRDAIWIPGPHRTQNVASLDFIDRDKAAYVLSKNASLTVTNKVTIV